MRLALLSDIHANLPALEAVLAEIAAADIEHAWCLGDVVGYGAQPDECATLVQERCSVCLVGNHDLAALDALDISTFSPAAAAAVHWTRERMSASTSGLPRRARALRTRAARSACTTPRRAIRSGSTCCGPTRPPSASGPRRGG